MRRPRPGAWRVIAFGIIVVASLGGAGIYVGLAVSNRDDTTLPPGVRVVTTGASLAPAPPKKPKPKPRVLQAVSLRNTVGPQLLFRSELDGDSNGRLAVANLASPNTTRTVANLSCDRVYYAGGRGLCLTTRGVWPLTLTYAAEIFDSSFTVVKEIPLPGLPSRARVSKDGSLGVTTVFVNGDSYLTGTFSTRTTILDLRTGEAIANLEDFAVTRNGRTFSNKNFNFWGVTFSHDDNNFYATLGSGRKTYLVRGSIRTRRMQVLHERVECPSLSPDEKRIAFKRSIGNGEWRLTVLDLKTMRETPLAETRTVDDQAEWLDNNHVLYGGGPDILVERADGGGRPALFVSAASSPVVVTAP